MFNVTTTAENIATTSMTTIISNPNIEHSYSRRGDANNNNTFRNTYNIKILNELVQISLVLIDMIS